MSQKKQNKYTSLFEKYLTLPLRIAIFKKSNMLKFGKIR